MNATEPQAPSSAAAGSQADPAGAPPAPRASDPARLMALKMVVITLGVILVALAVVVISTLVIRAVKGRPQTAAAPPPPVLPGEGPAGAAAAAVQATIPAGARVVSTTMGDGRLAVTVEDDAGLTTILFNAATLAETGRITWRRAP